MNPAEGILPYERDLFLSLNEAHTPFWDMFMWIYSSKFVWIPLVLVFIFVITYRIKWKEAMLIIIASVLIGILCDQLSASVIKPLFERLRPTYHPDFKDYVETVRGYRGGRYGFVSAHAANGFGIVTYTILLFRQKRYLIVSLIWVLVTCYSRIYLGLHFISDVIGGMIVGIFVGISVYYLYNFARMKILKIPPQDLKKPIMPKMRSNILCFTIIIIVASIAIYAAIYQLPRH